MEKIISRFKSSVPIFLERLIEASYLAIIFFVPLYFAYWLPTYNIFELNKISLFKVLSALLLFLTIIKVLLSSTILNVDWWSLFKRYYLVPVIFIFGLSISLIGSIDPIKSFFGSLDRQQGLVSYLSYFVWFVLISFNLAFNGADQNQYPATSLARRIQHLVVTASLSGLLVSIYGILQILNIDFLTWSEPPFLTYRTFSTLGQPNFLASWLLLVSPLSFYLFINGRCFFIKSFWLFTGILELLCLFFTASRGGLFALLAIIFIYLVYLFVSAGWSRRKKYLIFWIFIATSILSLIFLDSFSGGRLRELKNVNYGSFGARLNVYQSAAHAITQRPWLGYGLENADEALIPYYSRDWGVYDNVSQVMDRAHNLVLDIMVNGGVFVLGLFILLYYFFFDLARQELTNSRSLVFSLPIALAIGVGAYLISLLFSFTIVTGEIYFWCFLGTLVALNINQSADNDSAQIAGAAHGLLAGKFMAHIIIKLLIILATGLAILVALVWQEKIWLADYYFQQSMLALNSNDYARALVWDNYIDDLKINPASRRIYDVILIERLMLLYPALTDKNIQTSLAQRARQIYQRLSDQAYRSLLVKIKIDSVLGDYNRGRNHISRLLNISSHWPSAYLAAAQLEEFAGNQSAALLYYDDALLNIPDSADERLNNEHRQTVRDYLYFIYLKVGNIYFAQRDYGRARQCYRLSYANNPDDFTLLKKIADTYYAERDLSKAIKYTKHGWERNQGDYNWSLALGALYRELGDLPQADYYFAQALNLAPDQEDLKNIINNSINNN